MIYDNDWFTDVACDDYLTGAYTLGEIDLRGMVITKCFFGCAGGSCAHTMQQSIDDYNLQRSMSLNSGQCYPEYTLGTDVYMHQPGSGRIDDTQYNTTPGSNLIRDIARTCSPEHPLLVFIGGNATTVANAYLSDQSIADKLVVYMLCREGYNTSNPWPMYVLSKRVPCFCAPPIGNNLGGWWDPYDRSNELLNNEACEFLKSHNWDNRWRRTPADLVGFMYVMNHACASNATRIFVDSPAINGHVVTDNDYDYLDLTDHLRWNLVAGEFYRVMLDPEAWGGCVTVIEPPPPSLTWLPGQQAVLVEWEDPMSEPDNEDGFIIQRKPHMNRDHWVDVGSVGADVTSYTDTDNLHGLVQYSYRVGSIK